MRNGEFAVLQAWCESVPEPMRQMYPELSMWLAWSLCVGQQPARAGEIAERVLTQLATVGKHRQQAEIVLLSNIPSLKTQLTIIRGIAARRNGDRTAATRFLSQAQRLCPSDDLVLKSVIAAQRALLKTADGAFDAARRSYVESAQQALQADHALMQATALSGLASLRLRDGNHAEAQRLMLRANAAASRSGGAAIKRIVSATLALGTKVVMPAPLSPKELNVLSGLQSGQTDAQLAQALGVAISTVRWHCKNIYAKLGVHSRAQAVAGSQAHMHTF